MRNLVGLFYIENVNPVKPERKWDTGIHDYIKEPVKEGE